MSDKEYNVAVVGAGLVGRRLVSILEQRRFPMAELRILATSSRRQEIAGRERQVIEACDEAFEGVDIALFAGTEGETGASRLYGWKAVENGVFVVDNGGDFRMDDRVPLVIPEVNSRALFSHKGFIANPNCSTIQMVMALAPLHLAAGLKRVVVSTYQAVSGTGQAGARALQQQREAAVHGGDLDLGPYPHPIVNNAIPQVSGLRERFPGYYNEEIKMIEETRKIFDYPHLPVTATCVRVPVENSHSEAINAEFERPLTVQEARELLEAFDGVVVVDDPARSLYPLAADADGEDAVYVGRIRIDPSRPNTLDLWCACDNLRKGAALNTVQIAEKAVEMGLL
ncbi:MAG: aspartate-semialdehyde dehydrogenase [Planctomycetes bacterium]|nr:aspartate-semialdehyde dehydrogenase [Planctomycetota bacterium]